MFWNDFITLIQSDVAEWNAEFTGEPEQHLAVERLEAATFNLCRTSRSRVLTVEASDAGITCDLHSKAGDRRAGRRELPVWAWAVGAAGVIGVQEERRTLTSSALSELLIKRMLDPSPA